MMPVHPPYFPQDEYTDRSERFFASEIIREKNFLNYEQKCLTVQSIDHFFQGGGRHYPHKRTILLKEIHKKALSSEKAPVPSRRWESKHDRMEAFLRRRSPGNPC